MNSIFSNRPKWFWGIAAVAAVLIFWAGYSDRPATKQDLEHFPGVIVNERTTYDHVQSALYVRASDALKAGNAERAEAIYREIIAKYPQEADGYNALGACLYFQKKYDEAKAVYLRALEIDQKSPKAFYGLGCVAYSQNQMDEAKNNLEKALVYDEKDSLCHRVLGFVYEDSGDVAQAISHYEHAIALDPSIANDPEITQRLRALKSAAPAGSQQSPTNN